MTQKLTAYERVCLARNPNRTSTTDYISELFTNFIELCGDRKYADDRSIVGGTAYFNKQPVMIIAHRKGKTLEDNLACNFGMPSPEGYRKAERLMKLADKFSLPIITFVDTKGAFPGLEAENRGQGEAIARCLYTLSSVNVPVISVAIGEGGSGGALALAVANYLIMLENAIFSVLSPEGFASILWKDASKNKEACEIMKLTAADLLKFEIADEVINEDEHTLENIRKSIDSRLKTLLNTEDVALQRYNKLRKIGNTL